jgi:hypothetical protein
MPIIAIRQVNLVKNHKMTKLKWGGEIIDRRVKVPQIGKLRILQK